MLKYQLLRVWAAAMSGLYERVIMINSAMEQKLGQFNVRVEHAMQGAEDAAHDRALAAAQEYVWKARDNIGRRMDQVSCASSVLESEYSREHAALSRFAQKAERLHLPL